MWSDLILNMELSTNTDSSHLNLTRGNLLQNAEDPRVLAMSYLMYKIGKCSFQSFFWDWQNKHCFYTDYLWSLQIAFTLAECVAITLILM